jgi:hypothetical protein
MPYFPFLNIISIFAQGLCFLARKTSHPCTLAHIITDGKSRQASDQMLRVMLLRHCHLKKHLFKLELTDEPICERCLEENESATHILCDCEAIAYLKFRHLGQFFMQPSDYYDAPINKVIHFIRSVGLIRG